MKVQKIIKIHINICIVNHSREFPAFFILKEIDKASFIKERIHLVDIQIKEKLIAVVGADNYDDSKAGRLA